MMKNTTKGTIGKVLIAVPMLTIVGLVLWVFYLLALADSHAATMSGLLILGLASFAAGIKLVTESENHKGE